MVLPPQLESAMAKTNIDEAAKEASTESKPVDEVKSTEAQSGEKEDGVSPSAYHGFHAPRRSSRHPSLQVSKALASDGPIPLAIDKVETGKVDPSVEEKVLANVPGIDTSSNDPNATDENTKPVVGGEDKPAA